MEDGLVIGSTPTRVFMSSVCWTGLGHRLAVRSFAATDAGNDQMVRWLARLGQVADAGCGDGLAPHLLPRTG